MLEGFSSQLRKVHSSSRAAAAAPAGPAALKVRPGFAGRGRQPRSGQMAGLGGFAACRGLGAAAQGATSARPTPFGPRSGAGPSPGPRAGASSFPDVPAAARARLGECNRVGRPCLGFWLPGRPRRSLGKAARETEVRRGRKAPKVIRRAGRGGPGRRWLCGPFGGDPGKVFVPRQRRFLCVLAPPPRHRRPASPTEPRGGAACGPGLGWGRPARGPSVVSARLPVVGGTRDC